MTGAPHNRPGIAAERKRVNLFERFPSLGRAVKKPGFQFSFVFPAFILLYLFLIAGFFGLPVGNRNIIIVFVWILWWFLLTTLMVPFLSRIWCLMCPLTLPGEWLQRRAFVSVRPGRTGHLNNLLKGLNKRWPAKLRNIWLQNIGFVALGVVFPILATRPFVSALVLGGMLVLATLLAAVYQGRAFCRFVCPVGGFLGLYSMSSAVELRPVDRGVCRECKTKSCVTGSPEGWACPWFLCMGTLDRNNFCGMCMECTKSCASNNVGLFARPLFSDTRLRGADEVWKACIMLAMVFVYAVVLQGPWGKLREWANVGESGDWGGFSLYVLLVGSAALAVVPGLWALTAWASSLLAGRSRRRWNDYFTAYAYVLVPLGLAAWISFTLPLVLVNGSYVVSVISDPLGRGWDLFGTARVPWTPIFPEAAPLIQTAVMLAGLVYALKRGGAIASSLLGGDRPAMFRSLVPVAAFCLAATLGLLILFAG